MSTRAPVETEPLTIATGAIEHGWRRLPIAVRAIVVVIAVLVGINVLGRFLDDSTGGGSTAGGRRSSAYATQTDGLAAYAELLGRDGHPVERTRGSLVHSTLDPATTLVILDPDTISSDDAGALLQFVVNGGRLVTGGVSPGYFHALRDAPPTWDAVGPTRWTGLDSSLAPIATIATSGDGAFSSPGSTRPLVAQGHDVLVSEATVGLGTVVFVADASPLQNRLLGTADNAALGLALAGEPGRTVVFPEGVHGYGPSRGLAAVPTRWKVALLTLALAALVLMWARGRRLGPPEDTSRPLPPPRAAYVDAIGSSLLRTRRPGESLEIVARTVREHIDGLAAAGTEDGPGATGELDRAEFTRRARAVGLTDEEIAAVLAPVGDASVLAAGRALSRVEQSTRRDVQ